MCSAWARNKRLRAGIESQMQEAAARYAVTGKAGAGLHRVLLSDPQELEPESSGWWPRPNRLRANRTHASFVTSLSPTTLGCGPLSMSSSTVPEGDMENRN